MVSVRCHDRYLFLAAGYGEYSSHSVEGAAAGAGGKVPIVVKCNRGCGRSICAGGGSAESADVAAVSEGTESGEVSYTVSGKYCGSSSARVTPPSTSSAIEEAICCACESALAFRVVRCAAAKRRRQTVLMIKKKKITIRNSMKNRREPIRGFFFIELQAGRRTRGILLSKASGENK